MADNLHTVGFIKKSAAEFFEALELAEVKTVVDVRIKTYSSSPDSPKKTIWHSFCVRF